MRLTSRLDRYVLAEMRGAFALGFLGFAAVLLIKTLFDLASLIIERRVAVTLILGFLLVELPWIVQMVVPMAVLLAVLVGVGRLAVQSEVIALSASGVSPRRLFVPVLTFALAATMASLGVTHFVYPWAQGHKQTLTRESIRSRDLSREIEPGLFEVGLPDTVLYAHGAAESSTGRVFEGVFLYREDRANNQIDLIVAKRGRPTFDRDTGRVSLLLDDGEWHSWRPGETGHIEQTLFPHNTLTFPPDPVFGSLSKDPTADPKTAAGFSLYRAIGELERRLAETQSPAKRNFLQTKLRRMSFEWHRRWALPFAALLLAFAAFPLASRSERGGRTVGLTVTLLILFAYYLLMLLGDALDSRPGWPAWLGPWLPDIVTAFIGAGLWSGKLPSIPSASPARVAATIFRRLGGVLRRWPVWVGRRNAGSLAADADEQDSLEPALRTDARTTSRRAGLTVVDRYLTRAYVKMFGVVLATLLALVFIVDFKGSIEDLQPDARSFPWGEMFSQAALSIPGHLGQLIPLATLFGAAIMLAGLARGGEIIALKAAGIGPWRIATPLLGCTLLVCLAYAGVQELVAPAADRAASRVSDHLRNRPAAEEGETGRRWVLGEEGTIWSYLGWDAKHKSLLAPSVTVVDLDGGRIRQRVDAARATYTAGGWRFEAGWNATFPDGAEAAFQRFADWTGPFGEQPALFGMARSALSLNPRMVDQMSTHTLWENLQRLATSGFPTAPLKVGLNTKLAAPLLPLLLMLPGIPLVVSGWARKGSLAGFGFALLIAFAFWGVYAFTISLGREGWLNPLVAAWGPPVLVGLVGAIMLSRAR